MPGQILEGVQRIRQRLQQAHVLHRPPERCRMLYLTPRGIQADLRRPPAYSLPVNTKLARDLNRLEALRYTIADRPSSTGSIGAEWPLAFGAPAHAARASRGPALSRRITVEGWTPSSRTMARMLVTTPA